MHQLAHSSNARTKETPSQETRTQSVSQAGDGHQQSPPPVPEGTRGQRAELQAEPGPVHQDSDSGNRHPKQRIIIVTVIIKGVILTF